MTATRSNMRRLLSDDSGATAIEYALLAGLIAVVLIASVGVLGGSVMTNLFQTASSQLSDAVKAGS